MNSPSPQLQVFSVLCSFSFSSIFVNLLLRNNSNNKVSPLKAPAFQLVQDSPITGQSCAYTVVGYLAVTNLVPGASCFCWCLASGMCQSMEFQAELPKKHTLLWVQLWHPQATFFRDSFHRDFRAAAWCYNYDTILIYFYPSQWHWGYFNESYNCLILVRILLSSLP